MSPSPTADTTLATHHFCADCGAVYAEPTICEINGAGMETLPVPDYIWQEWNRALEHVHSLQRRCDRDLFSVRLRLGECPLWHVRIGRYQFGRISAEWNPAHRPFEFRQYPHGRFARATYGRTLPELVRRVLRRG